jgi:hypothetical protein
VQYNKLLKQLKLWWLKNYYTEQQSSLKYKMFALALNPKGFKNVSVVDACMFKFMVLFPNIQTYTVKLLLLNQYLKEDGLIPNTWCRYEYLETTLERFLIDNNLTSSDSVVRFTEFKLQYVEYCETILRLESTLLDNEKYNLRILKQFSVHMNELIIRLLGFENES